MSHEATCPSCGSAMRGRDFVPVDGALVPTYYSCTECDATRPGPGDPAFRAQYESDFEIVDAEE